MIVDVRAELLPKATVLFGELREGGTSRFTMPLTKAYPE
jgi:hypothetical protein